LPAQNGGSTIIGYQIQLDDGKAGPFKTVMGQDALSDFYMNLESEVLVKNLI
jgi:hypothetical protein